ncbi:hypothetical protein BRUCa_2342 [Brucella melitensis]|nr:hypothetical protein BM28_B0179 [Brucella melitensis M28]ADZ88296.1 hypothetical protein BM590_B0179 [Brucella melitensis M5-90]AEW18867.1 hypothetical protein BAA13334_II00497 [Brucella abortus A13334]AIB18841.1 Hypothetical protein BSSP3_II0147 [Brucella suis bv. 2]AIB22225.1 Hypothetical protein BSPT1_II0145 [Brucella suis bv. 2]
MIAVVQFNRRYGHDISFPTYLLRRFPGRWPPHYPSRQLFDEYSSDFANGSIWVFARKGKALSHIFAARRFFPCRKFGYFKLVKNNWVAFP